MGFEASGKLHTVFDTKQVSERFTKREFVVELSDGSKYPQTVLFQLTGDRCAQLDDLRVGDEVRVEFSVRGREWRSPAGEVKYFNSLDVWRVEAGRAQASGGARRAEAGRGDGRGDGRDARGADRRPERGGGGAAARGAGPAAGRGMERAPVAEYDPRPSDERGLDLDDIPF